MKNEHKDRFERLPDELREMTHESDREWVLYAILLKQLQGFSDPDIALHFATKCVPSFANKWLLLAGKGSHSLGMGLARRNFSGKRPGNGLFKGFWTKESISLWFFHLVGVECANCMTMFAHNFKFPAGGAVV
jgi:hypothetical protein